MKWGKMGECSAPLPIPSFLTHSLSISIAVSRWTCVNRYRNIFILDFIEDKDDGGGGDKCSVKTCKAPVKSSPSTVFYRPEALPVAQPTVSKHTEGKISHSMDLLTPNSTGGLPALSLTTNSPGYLEGGLPCLSSAL